MYTGKPTVVCGQLFSQFMSLNGVVSKRLTVVFLH